MFGVVDDEGFAGGGFVPGHGNGDTVPAMLTPGEFAIRKSSVQKLGADNLARMNKYGTGGAIKNDVTKRKKGRQELKRLNSLGGIDRVVASEGIVY